MKLEQERVKTVLIDTVALLCKNGLSYERELKIQAVIGVTVDDHDVFVVHINESFSPHGASSTSASSSSAAVAAETSMALVPVLPSGQQPKREFEAARTPSSGVKRMRAESMSSSMSPLSDVARQHARQQLRFASPAKSPAAGLPGHRVPGGMSPVPRAGGVMRGPGSGRGVMRGVQRAAMGRGFPAGRSQRGVRMSRGSGRPVPRGGSARGRGAHRMPSSFLPAQQSDNVPTKHEMKFSPATIVAAAETINSRMTPSFTAAESSVPFNFSPYLQSATASTARHNQGPTASDLPSFSAGDQGRFVNAAVAPGFGFDGVFSADSSSAHSGSFADINPSLEFDMPPSFNAAGGFVRSASGVQNATSANIKTESFPDVIFVDDDAPDSDTAATAAGENASSATSVGPGEVMYEGSADVGDAAEGVPGGAVQQITRRVTITTNIQGQNVKYEQV